MKNKELNKFLVKILAFTFLFFIASIFFSNRNSSKQKSRETALLNPKYRTEINFIQIKKDESEITIQKKGNLWLAAKNSTTVPADEKIISSLLENFSKTRTIYAIQKTMSTENSSRTEVLLKNNSNMSTKLDFYSENTLLNRIEFEFSNQFYETKDDLSQFLTADINYWSKVELLSEIENPVRFTLTVQNKKITINEDSQDFLKIKQDLSSLRHGSITSETSSKSPDFSLTSESGNGRLSTIHFTRTSEDGYICTVSITPSPADSTETSFALHSIKKTAEISTWTVKRILALFNS